jgi:MYXO-CTERM domain-containing protein
MRPDLRPARFLAAGLLVAALQAPAVASADLFVAELGSGEVSWIDQATDLVTPILTQAEEPIDVAVLPSNDLLVAERIDSDPATGRLTELDRSDDWAVLSVEEPGFSPNAIELGDDGTVYVATAGHGVQARGPAESAWSQLSDLPGEILDVTRFEGFLYAVAGSPAALYRVDPEAAEPAGNHSWLLDVPGVVACVRAETRLLCGATDDTLVLIGEVGPGGSPHVVGTHGPVPQPLGIAIDGWGAVHLAHREATGSVSSVQPDALSAWTPWVTGSELSLPAGIAWDPVCDPEDVDADGASDCAGDCDEADPTVHPTATEQCDGRDSDCDGLIDAEQDLDFDGWLACGDDCEPWDGTIFPGAPEWCGDGVDQDCDGADVQPDSDQDSWNSLECGGDDCDDDDSGVHPGAGEVCADGVDQDCDGLDRPADGDGDGYAAEDCGGDDCDDADDQTHPGVAYDCDDGIDRDCDGDPNGGDGDEDSYLAQECGGDDCDDLNPQIHPGEPDCGGETDTGRDLNCDGVVEVADADGDGEASSACDGSDCDDEDPMVFSIQQESCNGIDDNCNGDIDEDFREKSNEVDCSPRVAPGFPFPCQCQTAPPARVAGVALLLVGLLLMRRRRGLASRGRPGASATILSVALLIAAPAGAQDGEQPSSEQGSSDSEQPAPETGAATSGSEAPEPLSEEEAAARRERADRAALAAFSVHQQWCADAAGDSTTTAANALAAVGPVYADVSAAFDEVGDPLLLYWRGVLGTCMGQGERSVEDLRAFEGHEEAAGTYPGLVRDAKRRIARAERRLALSQGGRWDPNPWPTAAISLGGGAHLLLAVQEEGSPTWPYGAIDLDVSIRLIRFLRVVVLFRPAISGETVDAENNRLGQRSFLPEGGAGLMVRAPGPVRPTLTLFGRLAGTAAEQPADRLLGGAGLRLTFDFPFGRAAPLALRIATDVGILANKDALFVPFRVGGALVLALGRPAD